ncbi:FMN-binding protein [Streptococcus dysgalactiae]|uniref:FMN-binding protein n=1 Tax=Streptococcus dysgalactiae TaxID=1334 RepID=UPI000806F818|nr:FMN-binding protein [Streptococcus dysgalactiae]MCY7208764.1 FMN-binding protein [Streptococcus dysgalactiae]OBY96340.1 FMN-binding domain-containing protein [Streptococcus dysgalactiae subsp. equisimilis]OCX01367.1 FMN-binding domain-containing protein [Streptococcus dysgalactiae subsp. equisimilis]VTT20509.1 major membrane immunogen, membrane-anchored lipoprotein [Streptococcus dysgalactiae subsp. equisimilis]
MKKKLLTGSLLIASLVMLAACGSKSDDKSATSSEAKTEKVAKSTDDKAMLKDGTYKAESAFDERGWKVVHTITVADGKITASNFGYENKDGKLKADDEEYNKNMKAKSGVSSKEATEKLNSQLVEKQNLDDVEVVSGATHTSENFKKSTETLLEAAKEGKTDTIDLGK